MFIGEFISIGVAFSWTITALCIEYASKNIGSIQVNFIRLSLAFIFTGLLLLATTGSFLPIDASNKTIVWMLLSGLAGYSFGDFCLFYSYIIIGSRFGQLFMTLSPIAASITGYILLNESMEFSAILGVFVTVGGIALSVISKTDGGKPKIKLPIKGVLLGIGAGLGQGIGIVLSKCGMDEYYLCTTNSSKEVVDMIPFAAGQIRMIIGALTFLIILLISGKLNTTKRAFTDYKVSISILAGTIFGPFLGVAFSLLAVHYTASGIASTLMALTPIMIIPFAVIIQKQKVTLLEITGAIISIIGVYLFFI